MRPRGHRIAAQDVPRYLHLEVMMLMRLFSKLLPSLLMLTLLMGCGPGYLDLDKKVEATEENKQVFEVLKAYHAAIEEKDIESIKALVSPRYHENAGTTDNPADDYGFDKLVQRMTMLRDNVKKVQLRLKLREIDIKGDVATVEYEFVGRVLVTEGGVDSYKSWDDFNQMRMAREEGKWKIVGGL